jgi:hypothetical protein
MIKFAGKMWRLVKSRGPWECCACGDTGVRGDWVYRPHVRKDKKNEKRLCQECGEARSLPLRSTVFNGTKKSNRIEH